MKRKELINHAERKRIGERIAEMRKEMGISQVKLSEMTGIGDSHIARIETGRYNVGIDTLCKIGHALGYDIDYIKRTINTEKT